MSTGPTWADVANRNRTTERRDVVFTSPHRFDCPFCSTTGLRNWLSKVTGYRCSCGALFYTHQAVAVHFKERD